MRIKIGGEIGGAINGFNGDGAIVVGYDVPAFGFGSECVSVRREGVG